MNRDEQGKGGAWICQAEVHRPYYVCENSVKKTTERGQFGWYLQTRRRMIGDKAGGKGRTQAT